MITDVIEFRYAGFWRRFAALLLDGFIVVAGGLAGGIFLGIMAAFGISNFTTGFAVTYYLVAILAGWLYPALMESSEMQATLGKRALDIYVTDTSGRRISFARATGRVFAKLVNSLTFGIGWLMAAFTAQKRGLHDYIAGTLVLARERAPRTNGAAVAVISLAAALFAQPAAAQTCLGSPSFRQAPYQVGIQTAFTNGARGAGGFLAAGGDALFAGGGVTVTKFTDLNSRATNVVAFIGADVPATRDERVFVCPLAELTAGTGPDVGAIDISTAGIEGGGSVGMIASRSTSLTVIPTFGLSVLYNRNTAKIGSTEQTHSDTSGMARIGVGFVFNENVGITTGLSIPFSSGNSDAIFTLNLSYNFGR